MDLLSVLIGQFVSGLRRKDFDSTDFVLKPTSLEPTRIFPMRSESMANRISIFSVQKRFEMKLLMFEFAAALIGRTCYTEGF